MFFLTVSIKHDSIKNLVMKKNYKEAKYALCKVYKNCKIDSNVNQYVDYIKTISSEVSSNNTIKDALFNP